MRIFTAAIAAFFMLALPALAQEAVPAPVVVPAVDTVIQVPVGSWIDTAFTIWGAAIVSYIVFALRNLMSAFGPRVNSLLLTMQADQLMGKGLTFALNLVVGASKDKVWSIDVRNQILKELTTYVLVHGSKVVKEFIGTPADIAEKGFARMAPALDASGLPQPSPLPDGPKPDFVAIGAKAQVNAEAKAPGA